jgi:DNA-binding helix-hairpin-helix protein with protein kinase domain
MGTFGERAARWLESALGGLHPLASGGESEVFALARRSTYLYKKYHETRTWDGDLAELVGLPGALSDVDRSLVLSRTGWPLAGVVDDDGRACGVILPRADATFWFTPMRSPDVRAIAELTFPAKVETRVRWPAHGEVIAILRDFAELVTVLHAHGVVLGDISSRNCLFRLDPVPAILVIDCDSFFPATTDRDRRLQTPDWNDPTGDEASPATDCYKLALLVARVLCGDPYVHLPAHSGVRFAYGEPSPEIRHLIARAGTVADRPTAHEWACALGSQRPVPGVPADDVLSTTT